MCVSTYNMLDIFKTTLPFKTDSLAKGFDGTGDARGGQNTPKHKILSSQFEYATNPMRMGIRNRFQNQKNSIYKQKFAQFLFNFTQYPTLDYCRGAIPIRKIIFYSIFF